MTSVLIKQNLKNCFPVWLWSIKRDDWNILQLAFKMHFEASRALFQPESQQRPSMDLAWRDLKRIQ